MLFRLHVLGCLLLVVTARFASAQEAPPLPEDRPTSFELRYVFKPGQFVHYEVESESSMTVIAKEVKQTTHESQRTKKHFRVVTVDDDGSAVLEPVIDEVLMRASSDDNPAIEFDSRSTKPAPKVFATVKDSIGRAAVRVRFKSNGSVIEVLPVAGTNKPTANTASQHSFLTLLPEKAVAVGESWHDDFMAPVTLRLSENRTIKKEIPIRRHYTLKSVENGIAKIDFRTYPREIVREPDLQAQLIQRTLSGQLSFSISQGLMTEFRSASSNVVHGPFGPTSSMQTSAKTIERQVASRNE